MHVRFGREPLSRRRELNVIGPTRHDAIAMYRDEAEAVAITGTHFEPLDPSHDDVGFLVFAPRAARDERQSA